MARQALALSSCLMGACCQTSPHLLAAPPTPHTAPENHGAGSKGTGASTPRAGAQGCRFLPPRAPPTSASHRRCTEGYPLLELPRPLPLSMSEKSSSVHPQPLNPLCAQQPEFMGSFKNKSLKRLSLASRILQERLNKTTQRQKMLSMASPLGVKPPHLTPHLLWGSHVREGRGSHWE